MKEIEVKYKIQYAEKDGVVGFNIPQLKLSFFTGAAGFNEALKAADPIEAIRTKLYGDFWVYVQPDDLKKFIEDFTTNIPYADNRAWDRYAVWLAATTPAVKAVELTDFNIKNLFRFDVHSLYSFATDGMIALPQHLNYTDTMLHSADLTNFGKLVEYLKVHPFVKNLKVESIPHYNAHKPGDKGIEFVLEMPQTELDKYLAVFKDRGDKFWMCEMRHICWSIYEPGRPDPLGIRAISQQKDKL